MTESHEIAIVGGGIGGLTLARILQQKGLDAVIFERDACRSAREQGGTLDVHFDSGQVAITAAGLEEEFFALARPEGQQLRIVDKTGKYYWDEAVQKDNFDRPEIDRKQLRDLLIDSLEPDRIRWDHHLVSSKTTENGSHTLYFENGRRIQASVLIGADGAGSRIRPLLTTEEPYYSGVSFIETEILNPDSEYPIISAMVGMGTFMALSDNKGLIAQRNSDDRIRFYIALRLPENTDKKRNIQSLCPTETHQALQSLFDDWAPALKNFIYASEGKFILRPINMLPVGLRWETSPSITLLGDAAHLMSPFAGAGANLAMLDASELASELASNKPYADAIKSYETRMFARAKVFAEESERNLELSIAINGAGNMAEVMNSHLSERL